MERVSFRRAQVSDIETIRFIAKQGGLFHYPTLFLKFLISNSWIIVVEQDSNIIAYYSYLKSNLLKRTYMLQLGVSLDFQGKGLGSFILDKVCNEMSKDHNINVVLAHTLKPRVAKLFAREQWKLLFQFLNIFYIAGKVTKHNDK